MASTMPTSTDPMERAAARDDARGKAMQVSCVVPLAELGTDGPMLPVDHDRRPALNARST